MQPDPTCGDGATQSQSAMGHRDSAHIDMLATRTVRTPSLSLPYLPRPCLLPAGLLPAGRLLACLLLAGMIGCGRPPTLEVAKKFQEAQQIFDTAESPKEFLRAAGLYEEIRESGLVSGAVLFNQGNAYMRAGKRGEALACYRQAQRFRPRDPYLDANLRNALAGQPAAREQDLLRYIFFWQDWLSYREKFWLVTLLMAIAVLLATAAAFIPTARFWWRATLAALLISGVASASAAYDWYRYDYRKHGVVIAEQVTARKGDGENYEPAFNQALTEATEFRVIRQRNRWLLIQLSASQQGWVPIEKVVIY